jgi:hypothetical protein
MKSELATRMRNPKSTSASIDSSNPTTESVPPLRRSTASEVGRVQIPVLLRRDGRIAREFVPPRRDGHILVGTNDHMSML